MSWFIGYYQSKSGRRPVEDFIDSIDKKAQAKVARTLDLLEEFGIQLGMPYARHLEKDLWELRIRQAGNRYRIIYFLVTGKEFILLHGFMKKTGTVSRKDIEVADRRRNEFLSGRKQGI
jgi:phage-related protein